jgi:hypothetical protein
VLIKLEDGKSRVGDGCSSEVFNEEVCSKAEVADAKDTDSCYPWWDLSQMGHYGCSYSCSEVRVIITLFKNPSPMPKGEVMTLLATFCAMIFSFK